MFWETSTDDFNVKKYNIYLPTYIQLFNTKKLLTDGAIFC